MLNLPEIVRDVLRNRVDICKDELGGDIGVDDPTAAAEYAEEKRVATRILRGGVWPDDRERADYLEREIVDAIHNPTRSEARTVNRLLARAGRLELHDPNAVRLGRRSPLITFDGTTYERAI